MVFTVGVIKYSNRLPIAVVESPSISGGTFKTELDTSLTGPSMCRG